MGLVALRMWGLSSSTRDQTLSPCIGRQILNHHPGKSLESVFLNEKRERRFWKTGQGLEVSKNQGLTAPLNCRATEWGEASKRNVYSAPKEDRTGCPRVLLSQAWSRSSWTLSPRWWNTGLATKAKLACWSVPEWSISPQNLSTVLWQDPIKTVSEGCSCSAGWGLQVRFQWFGKIKKYDISCMAVCELKFIPITDRYLGWMTTTTWLCQFGCPEGINSDNHPLLQNDVLCLHEKVGWRGFKKLLIGNSYPTSGKLGNVV